MTKQNALLFIVQIYTSYTFHATVFGEISWMLIIIADRMSNFFTTLV